MPILGGLFSKKNKSSTRLKGDDLASTNATGSNESSPTIASYITPDSSVPSYPNAQGGYNGGYGHKTYPNLLNAPLMTTAPSSSSSAGNAKLRFFGRKKSGQKQSELTAQSTPDFQSAQYSTPQRPAHQGFRATSSETDPSDVRRLKPPPSRSAIFAAYADPGSALSTRSLPNDNSFNSDSSLSPPTPSPASAPPKRPSLFAWAHKPSAAPSSKSPQRGDSSFVSNNPPDSPSGDGSFNLKSFRHVRPPSPPPPPPPPQTNGSNVSLSAPLPRPRPRGESTHSDASQRISVAAFREAQARRSLAGSPSPSFRDSSPVPALPGRSGTPDGSRNSIPRPTSIVQNAQRRRSSMAVASTTEDSDSSEEEQSEDESMYRRSGRRQQAGKTKAKSEVGHGYMVESSLKRQGPRSHSGHSAVRTSRPLTQYEVDDKPPVPPRSQSSLGHYDTSRERASTSFTSMSPSASAQRAATLATTNSVSPSDRKVTPTQATYSQQTTRGRPGVYPPPSNSESGSDSDDAPLATLVAPRRPGSAMSSHSNPSLRSTGQSSARSPNPPKPLIDINEVTRRPPQATRPVYQMPKSEEGFTKGPTLLSQGNPTSYTSSPLVESPRSEHHPVLTQKSPPVKFASPVSTPSLEHKEFIAMPGVNTMVNTIPTPQRDSSPEQKRDAFSDRLARVVKKSLTSPVPTVSTATSASTPSAPSSPPIATPVSRDVSPFPQVSDNSQPRLKTEPSRTALPRNLPPVIRQDSGSPPDEDLAQLLGMGGIKFISRAGEEPESTSSESESESENSSDSDKLANPNRIAPIPIKQRSAPPAFAVTSRPSFPKQDSKSSSDNTSLEIDKSISPSRYAPRQRSSTLSVSPSAGFPSTKPSDSSLTTSSSSSRSVSQVTTDNMSPPNKSSNNPVRPAISARQRSSTMISPVSPSKTPSHLSQLPQQPSKSFQIPERPFISPRRNSPASSTGDSSSGRAPYTPADGSELGLHEDKRGRTKKPDEWSGGASGLGIKRQAPAPNQRRSVSFEDDPQSLKPPTRSHLREGARTGSEPAVQSQDEMEQRRRDRRRSEAKAAIELGKVINGPGPVLDDDDDMLPINQQMNSRMSTFNPMMPMGNPMMMPLGFPGAPGAGWGGMRQSMLAPNQFMMPPPSDPAMLAAHQQAMMYAKQAYQMAVAQQAMIAAGEEWERGSTVGGGGSVYGGSNAPSMIGQSFNMMGGMMPPNGWSGTNSVYGGPSPRFTPNGMVSGSRSDYGGGSRQSGNWASRSVYGESFGPSKDSRKPTSSSRPSGQMWGDPRGSGYFPPVPPIPANASNAHAPQGGPRARTTSQPSMKPSASALPRRTPPPSSWKASGV